jgi:hypothetical protein
MHLLTHLGLIYHRLFELVRGAGDRTLRIIAQVPSRLSSQKRCLMRSVHGSGLLQLWSVALMALIMLLLKGLRLRTRRLYCHLGLLSGYLVAQSLQGPRCTRRLNGRLAPISIMLRRITPLTCRGISLARSVLIFGRSLWLLVTIWHHGMVAGWLVTGLLRSLYHSKRTILLLVGISLLLSMYTLHCYYTLPWHILWSVISFRDLIQLASRLCLR